jgi:galactokinase
MSWTRAEYHTTEIVTEHGRMRFMARAGEVVFCFADIPPGAGLGDANAVYLSARQSVLVVISALQRSKQPGRNLIAATMEAAMRIAWPEA